MLPDLAEVPESLIDESIFDSFIAWTKNRGITLYPAQEEANCIYIPFLIFKYFIYILNSAES